MSEINNHKSIVRLPVLLTIAIAAGILIGANIKGDSSNENDIFKSLYKFRQVLTYINNDYVDNVNTDKIVEKAIDNMLEDLDPHTVYISGEELKLTKPQLQGNYSGIGIEFNIFKDTIYVVAPLSGGPSEAVGLQAGDKIVEVDAETVAGIGINNKGVFDRLRGPKGTDVIVSIKRDGVAELLEYTITRDKIPQYSVDVSYMVDEEIGYIKVNRFSATTYDEFQSHLNGLVDKGMKKLILDLTGNPGGYLDRAVKMADELLAGNPMIVYTKGKETRYDSEYRAERDGSFEKSPVIVLIDEGSASASEIVAGAIQDNDRGLIVGRRSFGKGLVQMPFELNDGSELRLTISRYYTPSGRSIQKPYDGKSEEYRRDILERYTNGEMYQEDSIKVADSLKFFTTKGREVYGGGGISPDHFVAIDTTMSSSYLNGLFTSNTLREFTLKYSNDNKSYLEDMGYEKFFDSFEVTDASLDEMVKLGEENGLPFNQEQFDRSKPLIVNYLKAHIARSVWKNDGFYPIFNQTNEIFLEAIDLFDQAEELANK